jgi:hypothetical protein
VAEKPREDKPEGKKAKTVLAVGIVKAVDAGKNTLTVSLKGEADRTVTAAKDADIEINGKSGKLADVPVGAHVLLELSKDQTTALRIQATVGSLATGEVKALDAARNTVTIAVKGGSETFTLLKDADIEIDGKPAKLGDVPVGTNVTLYLTVRVGSLQATGAHVPGHVKSVDAAKSTLTLTNKSGDQTFEVAKDARIAIDGKLSKLADLKEGMSVELQLSVDRKSVVRIAAGE